MNIGMILDKKFPPDIRVDKESSALIKSGFKVFLLCTKEKGQPAYEILNELRVLRGPIVTGFFKRKIDFWFTHLTFKNIFWKRYIRQFVIEHNIDVIHVHDLLISNTVLKSIEDLNIPVVIDLHENYPDALLQWYKIYSKKNRVITWLFFNYSRWIKREGSICQSVKTIITVVDEMKERLVNTHNISPQKIVVITNTEDPEFIYKGEIDTRIIKQYEKRFVMSYIGGFGTHRGIDTSIKGMAYLKNTVPEALLLLIGKGIPEYEKELVKLIAAYDVQKNVVIKGWQPFDKVLSYMKASTVGLIPHNSNEHTDNTVPHKLFQYLMANTPVLVSSCKPLKRITEKLNCGLVFEAGNPKDFAQKAEKFYKNKSLQKKLAANGLNATLKGELNWSITSQKLIDFYKQFDM